MSDYGYIKVASLSPRTVVANPRANAEAALNAIKSAQKKGAGIISLPELFISSYTCSDLFNNSTLISECEKALSDFLVKTEKIKSVIIIGLPVASGFELYNCAAVIQHGSILGIVPKTYIPSYGEFYEKRHFSSGAGSHLKQITICGKTVPFGNILFDLGNNTVLGVEICEDLWVPLSPSTIMALNGANIIVNISASDEVITKHDYRLEMIKQQSAKCICGYIYTSSGVGESSTDLVFSGASVIAENGTILKDAPRFAQQGTETFACFDMQKLNALRRTSSLSDNARISGALNNDFITVQATLPAIKDEDIDREYERRPFVPDNSRTREKRCSEIFEIQCAGLAKRMTHVGSKNFVVGISGGLDSTLAMLVCEKTAKMLSMPAESVICVTMPGFGTTDATYTNAVELISSLGAAFKEIDIKPACLRHMQDIGHNPDIHDITYENTQARERTQILMDIANKSSGLLIGTGDLSEMALGWSTYNGDHMSMYAVNCGVPKTLVKHLVKYVSDISNSRVSAVLKKVLDTPVSPELLPPDEQGNIKQKTEETIGAYEVHDFYLYHFIRFGFSPEKLLFIAKRTFEGIYSENELAAWLDLFLKRFFNNQFKRSCIPDGPKIGSVSLSPRGDWRMPSDADSYIWRNK